MVSPSDCRMEWECHSHLLPTLGGKCCWNKNPLRWARAVTNADVCWLPWKVQPIPTWLISSCVAFRDLMMVSSWIFPAARLCSSWFSSCCRRPRSALARFSSSSWHCRSDSWVWIWLWRLEICRKMSVKSQSYRPGTKMNPQNPRRPFLWR